MQCKTTTDTGKGPCEHARITCSTTVDSNTKSIKSTNKLTDPKKQKKLKSRKKISQDLIDHRLV